MAPRLQYTGAYVPFILGVLLLTSPSWSSEIGAVTESPYIDMTLGHQMHLAGACRGSSSEYEIGMGHKWQRMALGATIFWGKNAECKGYATVFGDTGRKQFPTWGSGSDSLGLLASGRFFIFSDKFWSQPYLGINIGTSTFSPFLVRGGVGAEVRLYSGFSLDFSACYSFGVFREELPSPHYSTIHDFLVAAGLRLYF